MNFEVVMANIIDVEADAIVLPANENLVMGSGASKAIFDAAGSIKLKKACQEIGHCDMGSAVPTPAFDMNAKYIIHAVVPRWQDGNNNEYGMLSSAYLTALRLADIMHCKSIAFPLLSSGNNGFDRRLAFKIATKSISSFEGTNLEKVVLVVFGKNMECFVRSLSYDVASIEKVKNQIKIVPDKVLKVVENGLKAAGDWLKDKENQKKLFELGINIASIVVPKNTIIANVIKTLKNESK